MWLIKVTKYVGMGLLVQSLYALSCFHTACLYPLHILSCMNSCRLHGDCTVTVKATVVHMWSTKMGNLEIVKESVDSLCIDGADMPTVMYSLNKPSTLINACMLNLSGHLNILL